MRMPASRCSADSSPSARAIAARPMAARGRRAASMCGPTPIIRATRE
jgi:hypothetical protein